MAGATTHARELQGEFPVFTAASREERLQQAILETLDVLEESRKAFKSRRLAFCERDRCFY